MEIKCSNLNQGYATFLRRLAQEHTVEPSRNGPVWRCPDPLVVTYQYPCERVLFSPMRNANPFLHLIGDALWLLAGRNDVEWPTYFAQNMQNYSDDGKIFHGAYGYRWRTAFIVDQFDVIAEMLVKDPSSRRAVMGMWSPHIDLVYACDPSNKDAPCNLSCCFDIRDGALNLTVFNRSNDAVWGLFGANAVQFSVLLEFMAAYVGVNVGTYSQISNNAHIYSTSLNFERMEELAIDAEANDHYLNSDLEHYPLVTNDAQQWLRDLKLFMKNPLNDPAYAYSEPFFPEVAIPMYRTWWLRKENHRQTAIATYAIEAPDWRRACEEWILRADAKKALKVGGAV